MATDAICAGDGVRVREIMVTQVRTVFPETPVLRAAQIMAKEQIRHLVVIDKLGMIRGVITERHLLKHFSPWLSKVNQSREPSGPPPSLDVGEIMVRSPITITPDCPVREAATILASKKIGCLPVEDSGRVVGIVTVVDLLRCLARDDSAGPQEEFRVYLPPAFVDDHHELQVPRAYFGDLNLQEGVVAVLSYAPKSKRIGVKLFPRGQQGEQVFGARAAKTTDKYLAIPVGDFLEYNNLNVRGPLDIEQTKDPRYVILSPVLSPTFRRAGVDKA